MTKKIDFLRRPRAGKMVPLCLFSFFTAFQDKKSKIQKNFENFFPDHMPWFFVKNLAIFRVYMTGSGFGAILRCSAFSDVWTDQAENLHTQNRPQALPNACLISKIGWKITEFWPSRNPNFWKISKMAVFRGKKSSDILDIKNHQFSTFLAGGWKYVETPSRGCWTRI